MINISEAVRIRLTHQMRKQMSLRSPAIVHVLVVLVALLHIANGQSSEVLSLEAHIPLPDVKGRIDHFSVDVTGQRLFVAAVENHTLEVVDLKSGRRVRSINDLAETPGCLL